MKIKAPLLAGVTGTVICAIVAVTFVTASQPEVADATQVKRSIAEQFETDPAGFQVKEASALLAEARIEGFAVCAPDVEATGEQYVEVASFMDKKQTRSREFGRVVRALLDDSTMSDCDFRVLEAVYRG